MYKCEICGKEFQTPQGKNGHRACHKTINKKCPVCGKKIKSNGFAAHLKMHENAENNTHKCLACGKIIPKGRKFCNTQCSTLYNGYKQRHPSEKIENGCIAKMIELENEKLKVKCEWCGKSFIPVHKDAEQKYCSQHCLHEARFAEKDKEYFKGNIAHATTLKRHFAKHNEYKCSICGIHDWNGKSITLILDHIDGNAENNLPSNLRYVCPNCDSQLPTYKSRNRGNGRYSRRKRYRKGQSY